MLLLGQFNYGKRGILDMTHTRLFTFTSLRRLLEQSGFRIVEMRGVPGPFPLAMGGYAAEPRARPREQGAHRACRAACSPTRSSWSLQPVPSLDYLLRSAEEESEIRAQKWA